MTDNGDDSLISRIGTTRIPFNPSLFVTFMVPAIVIYWAVLSLFDSVFEAVFISIVSALIIHKAYQLFAGDRR